jgi:hypothetical protein
MVDEDICQTHERRDRTELVQDCVSGIGIVPYCDPVVRRVRETDYLIPLRPGQRSVEPAALSVERVKIDFDQILDSQPILDFWFSNFLQNLKEGSVDFIMIAWKFQLSG